MAAYCTAADVRAEGFTANPPDDAAITAALVVWQSFIERVTRQWFDARTLVFDVDGTDSDALHFGVPIITITSLQINDEGVDLGADYYRVYSGNEYPLDRQNPRIKLTNQFSRPDIFTGTNGARIFRKGRKNQHIEGTFGYVEPDGSVPPLIKRALIKLVVEKLSNPIAGAAPSGVVTPAILGSVLEEWTDGHKLKYAQAGGASTARAPGLSGITEDQEILSILKLYRAPIGIATPAHWSDS